MDFTRQIFSDRQPKVVVCNSGRAMVLLNEAIVRSIVQVPVSMDEDGTMQYEGKEEEEYAYDVYWLDDVRSESEITSAAKKLVLSLIDAYDTSSSVNGFVFNGKTAWLDKGTRVGVMNSARIAKDMGESSYTLWIGGRGISMSVDDVIKLLGRIELYAQECYNVTSMHKAAVSAMADVDSVLQFDYTAGYPDKIDISKLI